MPLRFEISFRNPLHLALVLCVLAVSGGVVGSTSEPSIQWGECPDYPEFKDVAAECAFIPVPLRYSNPGRTAPIFVARVRGSAPETEKRGQLWFVTGGPGASAIGFAQQSQSFAELRPEWDYYIFEQRGIGNSAPLYCAAAADEAIVAPEDALDCLAELRRAWPEGIEDFTVTNTARDLAHIIDRLRPPGREVVVYGVSYGTYLVQRYLALRGEQPDAVILDSIVATGYEAYDTIERGTNAAARMVMDRCAKDADCRRRLAGIAADPWTALGVTFARLDQGQLCPELQARLDSPLTRSYLRSLFGTMIERTDLRGLMPAVVLRLNRCVPDDVMALEHLIRSLSSESLFSAADSEAPAADPGPGFVPYEQVKYSAPLSSHITLSELWEGTSFAQIMNEAEGFYAWLNVAPSLALLADAQVWPVYRDPLSDLHANTRAPALMLNSDIDSNTPLAEAIPIREDLNGPNQRFVTVPDAGHVVILNSLMAGAKGDKPADHCGTRVMLSFLDDPYGEPDTSCISGVERLSFDAANSRNRKSSLQYLGRKDMWSAK
ncbi:hypothetical protein [Methylocaldum gracile]